VFALLFACFGALSAQAMSVGPSANATGHAGQTVSIPIVLNLATGEAAGRAALYLRVTKSGGAPVIADALTFTASAPPGDPSSSSTSSDASSQMIALTWSTSSPFDVQFYGPQTVTLGNLSVKIPSSTSANGATYVVEAYGSTSVWYSTGGDTPPTAPWVAVGSLTLVSKNLTVPYYKLTTQVSGGNGTISRSVAQDPNWGDYPANTVVTLTANADPNYHWATWTGTDNNSVNPTTVTMSGNKGVVATFAASTHSLTVQADAGGSTNPSGTRPGPRVMLSL